MSEAFEKSPRAEVAAAEASTTSEPQGETSILKVIWFPILLFIGGPAIVMLAVKLLFGI